MGPDQTGDLATSGEINNYVGTAGTNTYAQPALTGYSSIIYPAAPASLFSVRKVQNGLVLTSGTTEYIFKDMATLGKWIAKEFGGKGTKQ